MNLVAYQRLLLLSLMSLLVVYAYMIVLNPVANKNPNTVIFLFHAIPLGICILLSYKKSYRGFIWVNFISLMLFCVATANVFLGYGWVVYMEIALTVCVFIFSLLAAMQYKNKTPRE